MQLIGNESYINKVIYKEKECEVPGQAAPALVLLQSAREVCSEMSTLLLELVVSSHITLSLVHTELMPSS